MKKILKSLFIIQEISNSRKADEYKLGRGFARAYRFNPYNPLSYIALLIILITGVIMFGFCGIRKEMDFSNPFKWN